MQFAAFAAFPTTPRIASFREMFICAAGLCQCLPAADTVRPECCRGCRCCFCELAYAVKYSSKSSLSAQLVSIEILGTLEVAARGILQGLILLVLVYLELLKSLQNSFSFKGCRA